ncbi:hypothetical protein [Streptomyces sp. NPDC088725]|uniref:hypothetical protein n=1 Tax=Streptomyces sp. NPDC088725 TaxID=3365873 RepID=UPI00382A5B29
MRNPVGPLPSSIYWRRRSVAAALIVLLALLVVWLVGFGGGGGKKHDDSRGAGPAPSITPGPSESGPAISEQPGGRDESGGTDGGDGGKNGDPEPTGGAGSGGGTGGGDGDTGATGGDSGSTGGGAATGGGASTGREVPVSSSLPTCDPKSLTLRLDTQNRKSAWAPGEKPVLLLVAKNTSDTTCKADFGPKAMVVSILDISADEVWSTKDCPKADRQLFEVPAGGTVTRALTWDRKQTEPKCAEPPKGEVPTGATYLAGLKTSVATVKSDEREKSITLNKD